MRQSEIAFRDVWVRAESRSLKFTRTSLQILVGFRMFFGKDFTVKKQNENSHYFIPSLDRIVIAATKTKD